MSIIVVTGAGQGQGAAEARLLAAQGATVIAVDLTEVPAEVLPGADYRQLDVTDEAGWAVLAKDLAERYGCVHGLVANAGISRPPTPPASGPCVAWPRWRAWNWARAASGSTSCIPATSRPR